MSFTDPHILPVLYDALATPPISPTTSVKRLPYPLVIPFIPPPPHEIHPPLGSLLPSRFLIPPLTPKLPIPPKLNARPLHLTVDTDADSISRVKKAKMPSLSHLLIVGVGGRVLSLAADGKYVYAGCQSGDNEIVVSWPDLLIVGDSADRELQVFSRVSLQPMFRLLGHERSVLALMVVEEKGWLVSSSSRSLFER